MKGYRILHITYPGYISLPIDNPFPIKLAGRIGLISIVGHVDAVVLTDFKNAIRGERGRPALERQIRSIHRLNIDVNSVAGEANTPRRFVLEHKSPHGRWFSSRFYTYLTLTYEVANPPELTPDERAFSGDALSEFIATYKFIAADSRIALPREVLNDRIVWREGFASYDLTDLALNPVDRMLKRRIVDIGIKEFTALQLIESLPRNAAVVASIGKSLSEQLMHGGRLHDELRLLSKAFDELDVHRNYKYALLESFIVVESVLSQFLRTAKLGRGISKTKLDAYETEVGVGYQLNIELPALFSPITKAERELIGKVDRIRKIRNDVVHKGRSVTETEAFDSIRDATNFIQFLWNRETV